MYVVFKYQRNMFHLKKQNQNKQKKQPKKPTWSLLRLQLSTDNPPQSCQVCENDSAFGLSRLGIKLLKTSGFAILV